MSGLATMRADQLMLVPIVLPLATATLLMAIPEAHRRAKALVDLGACVAGLAIGVALLGASVAADGTSAFGIYLGGNWRAPFGIALAVDRLAALMLTLTGVLGIAAALFSMARWQHAGAHFHALLQLQLMGINGAFLAADLFNLFVFFEVMLAASYGLLLHGSGRERVGAGLKYVAINLLASTLFLVGVAVVYGIVGTLNYADIARKIALLPARDRGLLHAGAAMLGIALLTKAAMWPLGFWVARTYRSAAAPVAALFAMLTKVGVYAVLRLWMLFAAFDAHGSLRFGGEALILGGMLTIAFGAAGLAASLRVSTLAAYAIVVSSGTLLAAVGIGEPALVGAAIYYLIGSTLGAAAMFLIAEMVERMRRFETSPPIVDHAAEHLPFYVDSAAERASGASGAGDAGADEQVVVGQAFPVATAFVGASYMAAALLVAGMPPLSGFLAKFAMLHALFGAAAQRAADRLLPHTQGMLGALIVVSGLVALIALSRAGARFFWAPRRSTPPRLALAECVPVAAFVALFVALVVWAGPVLDYADAAAAGVVDPTRYVEAVMSATPVPSPGAQP
jgi:multicomponent K+:H+ antiporter subunit D